MARKINILSFRNIDDKTTEEYFNLITKNHKRLDCYYCPYCMNKVLCVKESESKSDKFIIKKQDDLQSGSMSRICDRCKSFMPHAFEVDYSGIMSFSNGMVTN